MGVFNEPERLAKVLASIKVNYEERPLKPIQVANELCNACHELDDDETLTQKRFGIGKSMWSDFKRLLNISDDIQNMIKWGKTDPKTFELGFSVANTIAKFPVEEQNKLVAASWEYDKALTHDDLEDIYSFKKNNTEKTIEECISEVFHVRHPKQEIIRLHVSGLDTLIFENLKKESLKQDISINKLSKNILAKKLPEGSIFNANPRTTFIQIIFSDKGRKEFEKLFLKTNIPKNDFVNHIFREEGF